MTNDIKNNALDKRFGTTTTREVGEWIEQQAKNRGIRPATFIRMVLIDRFNMHQQQAFNE